MRRRVRVVPLARRRIGTFAERLRFAPISDWPTHLGLAWKILHDELGLADERASSLVINSVLVAHICAQAIDRQSAAFVEAPTRKKVGVAFKRLANCAQRASAKLKRSLSDAMLPLRNVERVDLEVIEEFLEGIAATFAEYSAQESARTALSAMSVVESDGRQVVGIKNSYSSLNPAVQRRCECVLLELSKRSKALTAAAAFRALALAIEGEPVAKTKRMSSPLIVDYVVAVAELWLSVGLRSSRARNPLDARYKGRFHRFVELILTEMIEPWTTRHEGNLDGLQRKTYLAHAELPGEYRRHISPAVRRSAVEWLVSDSHVREALARIQKTAPVSP